MPYIDTYDRIQAILDENNMTAYQLSKKTGISTGLLSQWKKRTQEPSNKKLKLIADVFNISLDYLLGNTDIKKTSSPEHISEKK